MTEACILGINDVSILPFILAVDNSPPPTPTPTTHTPCLSMPLTYIVYNDSTHIYTKWRA